jgi:hypothetical protein
MLMKCTIYNNPLLSSIWPILCPHPLYSKVCAPHRTYGTILVLHKVIIASHSHSLVAQLDRTTGVHRTGDPTIVTFARGRLSGYARHSSPKIQGNFKITIKNEP